MAQLSNIRRIRNLWFGSLEREMPVGMDGINFAVFCGTPQQRLLTCLHAIDRYRGRCGIVVLHNSQPLENALVQMSRNGNRTGMQVVSVDRRCYDPLYGMDKSSVKRAIVPPVAGGALNPEVTGILSGLDAYLQIMEQEFNRNPGSAGQYPFNLDRLLHLTGLPVERLKQEHLASLPQYTAKGIADVLGRPYLQQKVCDAVKYYASVMESCLWTPGSSTEHSRISINQAVRENRLISIRIPGNRKDVMDAISQDLRMLTDRNIPFLVVSYGLQLTESKDLQSLFLRERDEQRYFTGVVSESLGGIANDKDSEESVFNQNERILVYKCGNTKQAEGFTAAYGRYLRKEIEHTHHVMFPLPRIIPAVGGGDVVKLVEEMNIRPDELTRLRNGVFLCGKEYEIPVLVKRFTVPGGDSYDLSLSRMQTAVR